MEILNYQMLAFLLIAMAIGLIMHSYSIVRDILDYFLKDYINRFLLLTRIKPKYKRILIDYCVYYHQLDEVKKKTFRRRVQKFISMKKFIPRGDMRKVTDEMKVLIASSAIQITFGHPSVYFEHFWKILVYPDTYYSNIAQRYHQGEVNTRGFIILSWTNFLDGYKNRSSGVNLGLHEMAHALKIENAIRNTEYDFLDFDALKSFDIESKKEIEEMRNGNTSFLRVYASTNEHEFFAVVIESFFERPQLFMEKKPYLFELTAKLLNQNPLNGQEYS